MMPFPFKFYIITLCLIFIRTPHDSCKYCSVTAETVVSKRLQYFNIKEYFLTSLPHNNDVIYISVGILLKYNMKKKSLFD